MLTKRRLTKRPSGFAATPIVGTLLGRRTVPSVAVGWVAALAMLGLAPPVQAQLSAERCQNRRDTAVAESNACMKRYTNCVHTIVGPCGQIQDECLRQSRKATSEYNLCMGQVSANHTDRHALEALSGSRGCNWAPQRFIMPANGGDCGFNDVGLPNPGLFDCGQNDRCQSVCNFVACKVD